jgi:type IV pilus assembly protein PilA
MGSLSIVNPKGNPTDMLAALRKRADREDEGFTLIELMVVVLIIAILLAIAIPTFLGARNRAQDRAVQSNIRNALTAEKTYYTDNEKFVNNSASDLTNIEPSLTYQAGFATSASTKNDVFVTVGNVVGTDGNIVCLSGKSASGNVFSLKDIATGTASGTYYLKDAITACDTTVTGFVKTGWK